MNSTEQLCEESGTDQTAVGRGAALVLLLRTTRGRPSDRRRADLRAGAGPVDSPGTRTPARSTGFVGGSPSSWRSSVRTPSRPSSLAGVATTVSGGLHAALYSSAVSN